NTVLFIKSIATIFSSLFPSFFIEERLFFQFLEVTKNHREYLYLPNEHIQIAYFVLSHLKCLEIKSIAQLRANSWYHMLRL
ncbi:MAG: hypothetical protein LCH30_02795, partial [Proteobacteria bacterium]|nr:hypothetical protein [Pseudomonadota bacterium]